MVSWFFFFFDLLCYFLINMVSLFNHSAVLVGICSTVYIILSSVVLYYAIRSSRSDPSDPLIYEQRLVEA